MELLVNLSVKNMSPTHIELAWSFIDEKKLLDSLKGDPITGFNLYYAESPESFHRINNEVIDGFEYKHILFNYDKFKNHYYQIELITLGGKSIKSPKMTIYPQLLKAPFNAMRTHVFKLVASLSQIKSSPVLFYQRRTTGVLCSACGINKTLGSIRTKCPICKGTGYQGGYYTPVLAWVKFMKGFSKSEEDQGMMKSQTNTQIINTSSYFVVPKINDYFRELKPPFRVYCVAEISNETQWDNAPVSIQFVAAQEDSFHQLYGEKIPFVPELNQRIYWERMFDQIDEIRSRAREAVNAS